jgi:hypothetical protein
MKIKPVEKIKFPVCTINMRDKDLRKVDCESYRVPLSQSDKGFKFLLKKIFEIINQDYLYQNYLNFAKNNCSNKRIMSKKEFLFNRMKMKYNKISGCC